MAKVKASPAGFYFIQQQVSAILIDLVKDFPASSFIHLDFGANRNEIFQGRIARLIDRRGMLSVITFGTERQIVCWSQMPCIPAVAVPYHWGHRCGGILQANDLPRPKKWL